MEYFVKATHEAEVGQIRVAEGEAVQMKQELITFKKSATQTA